MTTDPELAAIFAKIRRHLDELHETDDRIARNLGYASVEDYDADLLAREERSKLHVV